MIFRSSIYFWKRVEKISLNKHILRIKRSLPVSQGLKLKSSPALCFQVRPADVSVAPHTRPRRMLRGSGSAVGPDWLAGCSVYLDIVEKKWLPAEGRWSSGEVLWINASSQTYGCTRSEQARSTHCGISPTFPDPASSLCAIAAVRWVDPAEAALWKGLVSFAC